MYLVLCAFLPYTLLLFVRSICISCQLNRSLLWTCICSNSLLQTKFFFLFSTNDFGLNKHFFALFFFSLVFIHFSSKLTVCYSRLWFILDETKKKSNLLTLKRLNDILHMELDFNRERNILHTYDVNANQLNTQKEKCQRCKSFVIVFIFFFYSRKNWKLPCVRMERIKMALKFWNDKSFASQWIRMVLLKLKVFLI